MWNESLKGRTSEEIAKALIRHLNAKGLGEATGAHEGFHIWTPQFDDKGVRWFACYVVEGENEGHYIHIGTVTHPPDAERGPRLHHILCGAKTFAGREKAYEVAAACAELLESWTPIDFTPVKRTTH